MGCAKCCKMGGGLFLLVGVLFLLVDLGMWDFWGIQWWTAAFLLLGVGKLGIAHCKACMKKK